MKMTCAIHVIVIQPSAVEEGNVHIIYDHNTQNLHFRVHAHSVSVSETFVQIIYCDRWLLHTALTLNGRQPPLISYGVISRRLPSLIRLGTITLSATTTKHARQVWLPPLPQIDIKLSRRASAIKRARTVSAQTLQSKVTDGLASSTLSQCVTTVSKSSLTV